MDHFEIILYIIIGVIYFLLQKKGNQRSKKATIESTHPRDKQDPIETETPKAKPILSWNDLLEEFTSDTQQEKKHKPIAPHTPEIEKIADHEQTEKNIAPPIDSKDFVHVRDSATNQITEKGTQKSTFAGNKKIDRLIGPYSGLKRAIVINELIQRQYI